MKVLVVEDDKKLSLAICARLHSYGYEAIAAVDAFSAMSLAIKHQPNLALVDINLPGGDGFTVIERFNSSGDCHNMPTIMMTANREDGLESKAREIGARVFLQKPFGATVLLDAIQAATDGDTSNAILSR